MREGFGALLARARRARWANLCIVQLRFLLGFARFYVFPVIVLLPVVTYFVDRRARRPRWR